MKRTFDLLISFCCLIILSPLFLVIGFFIKLNDMGPVIYKQVRVGKKGKLFILYKFRSMKVNDSSGESSFEPGNTSRVTTVGKFLRRTKLDELPQIFNVFRGDMSFVGPRPEIEKWVAVYSQRWEKVLCSKPGMTDNASIEFRNEEELLRQAPDPAKLYREDILPRKLALYEDYLNNHTFWGDILIIIRTIKSVVFK